MRSNIIIRIILAALVTSGDIGFVCLSSSAQEIESREYKALLIPRFTAKDVSTLWKEIREEVSKGNLGTVAQETETNGEPRTVVFLDADDCVLKKHGENGATN